MLGRLKYTSTRNKWFNWLTNGLISRVSMYIRRMILHTQTLILEETLRRFREKRRERQAKFLNKFQIEHYNLTNERKQHRCLSQLCLACMSECESPTSKLQILRWAGGRDQPTWLSHLLPISLPLLIVPCSHPAQRYPASSARETQCRVPLLRFTGRSKVI